MINPQAARFESGTFYQYNRADAQYPDRPIDALDQRRSRRALYLLYR